ncbi:MAG: calcium/sodium antiporter [Spirochaetaceae bacterium]
MAASVFLNVLLVLAGLVLLYFGGDFLVAGASGVARKLEIPVLVIGLTVVAFGTSAPELFVSLISAWKGLMPVSVGNIIGSNIVNIALVLGLVSLVRPLEVSRKIAFIDTPIMLGTYVVLALVVFDFESPDRYWRGGTITTAEGVLMVALLVGYLTFLYFNARGRGPEALEEVPLDEITEEPRSPMSVLLLKVAAGIAGLTVGGQLLVDGASWIAENVFGASERFIGITVVALGTSLPELSTSLAAIIRGETDISLGNIVGSNIFNSLLVLGTVSILRNIDLGAVDFRFDFLFMAAVSLFLFIVIALKRRLPRWGGVTFFIVYILYFVFLIRTRAT